jgi:hypothetical protein
MCATRKGAEHVIASRNAEKLNAEANRLGQSLPTGVNSNDSVAGLFRDCGPIGSITWSSEVFKTGPVRTVAMGDVRSTMESKFWGADAVRDRPTLHRRARSPWCPAY